MALVRKRQEEEHLKQEEKLREIEELKQMRNHYLEKTKEILKMPQIVAEKRNRGGGGGGRRKRGGGAGDEFVNDSSDLGEYDGMGEGGGESNVKRSKVLLDHIKNFANILFNKNFLQ